MEKWMIRFFVLFCAIVFVESVHGPKLGDILVERAGYPCGVLASNNIIHHNPWMVYLDYLDKQDRVIGIRCGATLITRKHILTAAHCVKLQPPHTYHRLVARLGEYDENTRVDCVRGVCAHPLVMIDVNMNKVQIHPGYNGLENDIAVLELMKITPYTDFIRPICPPSGKIGQVTFIAAGWGETTDLHVNSPVKKIIPLPIFPTEICRKVYSKPLPQKIICAGGEYEEATCRGDSGGPLMLYRSTRVEIWGVVSMGNVICGKRGTPGIYTSVPEHMGWIKKAISS